MPHDRNRHLAEPFATLITHARIVGILGHRQVGKSTFTEAHSNEYCTLDDEDVWNLAHSSPKRFIQAMKGDRSAIDECQLLPSLFPALKVRIGTRKTPGQFILTGSVRFTSRSAIKESLTGRISNLELFPMVLTELEKEPNSSVLLKALTSSSVEPLERYLNTSKQIEIQRSKAMHLYLERGGLPGLCFVREDKTRRDLLKDLLETILDRDLRLVYRTSMPYQQIFEYCVEIAEGARKILRPTVIRRRTRIAEITQKHLLRALESVFLIRRIPVEGDYRGDLFWFEDQLERSFFSSQQADPEQDWLELLYRNIRAQFAYRIGESVQVFQYRTRGGAFMPLAYRGQAGVLGIYPIETHGEINRSLRASAESFLKAYNHSKVLFLTQKGTHSEIISDRIMIMPAQIALF